MFTRCFRIAGSGLNQEVIITLSIHHTSSISLVNMTGGTRPEYYIIRRKVENPDYNVNRAKLKKTKIADGR